MKYRTDFVTNSSSSAFIFEKGLDYKELFQKEELLGLEKEIEKISDLGFWEQMCLFWWFGINEYIYHKKEAGKDLLEARALIEEVITKRTDELLAYVERLQEQKVTYGALLMQYFGCEDVIYTEVDLDIFTVIELGHLWDDKKIRWLTWHR